MHGAYRTRFKPVLQHYRGLQQPVKDQSGGMAEGRAYHGPRSASAEDGARLEEKGFRLVAVPPTPLSVPGFRRHTVARESPHRVAAPSRHPMPVDPRTSDFRDLQPVTGQRVACAPHGGHLWRLAVVLAVLLGMSPGRFAVGQAPGELLPPPASPGLPAAGAVSPVAVPPTAPPPLSGPVPSRPESPAPSAALGAVDESNRIWYPTN